MLRKLIQILVSFNMENIVTLSHFSDLDILICPFLFANDKFIFDDV
jgi:hypothetical protein